MAACELKILSKIEQIRPLGICRAALQHQALGVFQLSFRDAFRKRKLALYFGSYQQGRQTVRNFASIVQDLRQDGFQWEV